MCSVDRGSRITVMPMNSAIEDSKAAIFTIFLTPDASRMGSKGMDTAVFKAMVVTAGTTDGITESHIYPGFLYEIPQCAYCAFYRLGSLRDPTAGRVSASAERL